MTRWAFTRLASLALLPALASPALSQLFATKAKVAAVVNGQPITIDEVEAVVKLRPPPSEPPSEARQRQMRMDALQFLIDERIMQQFLARSAPPVDKKDIAHQFSLLQSALKAQGKTLEDFFRETGLTEAQLNQNITNRLLRDGYLRQRLSEAEVRRYYDEHRAFFDQVTVKASHIVLRTPPTATDAERQAAQTELEAMRREILDGKIDFAEAARQHSQCQSAPAGGDLGYFPRKWAVDEALAKAAFSLRVGEVSGVVASEYGLHLIKVTDRKQNGPASKFERMAAEVRETAAEEMLETLLTQLRKSAQVEIKLTPGQTQTSGR